MTRVTTIGVHGWSVEAWLAALRQAEIELLVDIRQRRGVRGAAYAWANAQRLQAALLRDRIAYEHRKDLAPTTALRELQYSADERAGVGKRSRERLSPAFAEAYRREVLAAADLSALRAGPPAALLCVEREPDACHRSLVAEALGLPVLHLRP